jgi:hypothetical protein
LPDVFAVNVFALPRAILFPPEVVPCQYHVMFAGEATRVKVLFPQFSADTCGTAGTAGEGFTVTFLEADIDVLLSQLEATTETTAVP